MTRREMLNFFNLVRDQNYLDDSYCLRFPSFMELMVRCSIEKYADDIGVDEPLMVIAACLERFSSLLNRMSWRK